jgi:uncharacterized membrane protein YphA (DoxX/SURF4 family)
MSDTLFVQPAATGRKVASWVIQGLLAAAFLAAAGAKLAGVPMMVQVFDQIGLGQGFRFVTAAVEITGAVLILVPGFAAYGAVLLGATMACAIAAHVFILHSNPGGAIVLFVVNVVVLWLRRAQLRGRFLRTQH